MEIREYRASDMPHITALIYETVHAIDDSVYTAEQKQGWAPESLPEMKLNLQYALVAITDNQITAFVDFDDRNSFINYLYTAPRYQGKGIASQLYERIEERAIALRLSRISARASKTAVDFFKKRGFDICWENEVVRGGAVMDNYTMNKSLA